jgi:hypothetical protein
MTGVLGFNSRQGLGIFLFATASRMSIVPTQPPIQWVAGAFSLGQSDGGVKLTTHLHLVPRSKNEWRYTSTPPIRLHGVVLSKSTRITSRAEKNSTALTVPMEGGGFFLNRGYREV